MPASEGDGLEDVVAGRTAIAQLVGGDAENGVPGRLFYRGYDVADLVQYSTFEETLYLLWYGELPRRSQLEAHDAALAQQRALPQEVVDLMRRLPASATSMEVLRTVTSALGLWPAPRGPRDAPWDAPQERRQGGQGGPQAGQRDRDAPAAQALRLTAQFPTIVATWHHLRAGSAPPEPDQQRNTAAGFLTMLHAMPPPPVAARALDVALILHADHEFNASTFAARVTAATLADVYSAITSATGTLSGPLHGGANQDVIRLLEELGSLARVDEFLQRLLADPTRRVPGFGHRVYKGPDPRTGHLREWAREVSRHYGDDTFWTMTRRIEEGMWQARRLYGNVDLYSAVLYHALGLPVDLFPSIFAIARIAGWTAHVLEQYADNRLIRPIAEYTGRRDRRYIPLDQR